MINNIIQSWAFLEMMNPGEIPSLNTNIDKKKVKDGKNFKQIVPISQATSLIESLEINNPQQYQKNYTYYMGAYRNVALVTLLRQHFKNKEEIINKSYNLYYSFSFDVNEEGVYKEESLSIPHVQLIIDDIKRKGFISYADFTERYEEKKMQFEEEFRVLMQNGITPDCLNQAEILFSKRFSSVTNQVGQSYLACSILKNNAQDTKTNFNSFYLDDLQSILKNGSNEMLSHFIQGTDLKIDVNENREVIEEILKVDQLPNGRWPSPVNHRLSLMQQVAVNLVLNEDLPISSVNGPPGTGKTTLLKDIFAQLIVERAEKMTAYKNPKDAFIKVGQQAIKMSEKDYTYNMYELDPAIAKYSIVVASSNNGAVENISKDLPLLNEIIRKNNSTTTSNRFDEYDSEYAKQAKELDYFSGYAEKLLDEKEAWGLFSGAFGKNKNIETISGMLQSKKDSQPFLEYLQENEQEYSWEQTVKEFHNLKNEIEQEKKDLQQYIALMSKITKIKEELTEIPNQIEQQKEQQMSSKQLINQLRAEDHLLKERLNNRPKKNVIIQLFYAILGKVDNDELSIRQEREELLKNQLDATKQLNLSTENITKLTKLKRTMHQEIDAIQKQQKRYENEDVVLSTDAYWAEDGYNERQISVLWQTHELNFKRGLLFLKAMQVHKAFLQKNHDHLKVSLKMLQHLKSINLNIAENKRNVGHMWKTLHLVFPVMSTTFASLGRMYKGMDAGFIDYLFIDEAGQASPQQAAGGLWRSKRAIVVGDPIQIEPVVTLDATILSDIRKSFNVSEQFIGPTASVQTIADAANPVGTIKGEDGNQERIGVPLWVHRRCIEPMFSIANEIAYDNQMVLALNKIGEGKWYDITGKTSNAQYVKEQGEFVVGKIEEKFKEVKEGETPSLFIITPFTAVKSEIIKLVKKRLPNEINGINIEKWANASIGTVHTFQGKEADVVYFVTGTDTDTDGAANWSCIKPNLLNVAVTRAKNEFYVVGDLKRFQSKNYYETIVNQLKQTNI